MNRFRWMQQPMEEAPATAGGGVPGTPPPIVKDPAIEAMEKQLAKQEETIGRLTTAVQNQPIPQQQPPAQTPSKADIEKEFFKNPLDVTAAIVHKTVSDAIAASEMQNLDTLVESARTQARNEDTAFFDKYALEIEAKVKAMAPPFQKNVMIWRNAIKMTKGEHLEDLIKAAVEKPNGGPPDGPRTPGHRQPDAPKDEPLTEDERTVAKGLRISEERYKRGKKHVVRMGDKGNTLAEGAFDRLLTFDSVQKEAERAAARAAKKS